MRKRKSVEILSATGLAGTVYVADTRQIHRGTPVIEGSRFILNFTVALNDFGSLKDEKYNSNYEFIDPRIKEIMPPLTY